MGRTARAVAMSLAAGTIGLVLALAPTLGIAASGEGPIFEPASSMEPPVLFQLDFSPRRIPPGDPGDTLTIGIEENSPPRDFGPGIASVTVGLGRSIQLEPRGLSTCGWGAIEASSQTSARDECRRAIVGYGEATIGFFYPENDPIAVSGKGVIYNGGARGGAARLLLAIEFGPPFSGTFHLAIPVHSVRRGRIGSELAIEIPRINGGYGVLKKLRLELGGAFVRDREPAGFVTAECRDGKLLATSTTVLGDGTEERDESSAPARADEPAVEL